MSKELMIGALRQGKTGDEILQILEVIASGNHGENETEMEAFVE